MALRAKESDCFKRAAMTLTEGCQVLSVSESTKIKYTLMLTLCELSTASMKAPRECRDIDSCTDKQAQQCVMKLATSPQTWTSYSGYFRDVEQMCFAIRYPIEKDLLEKLRRDIAENQIKNFGLLREQQAQMISWREEEMRNFEVIHDAQKALRDQLEDIEFVGQKAETNLGHLSRSVASMHREAEVALALQEDNVQTFIENSRSSLNEVLLRTGVALETAFNQVESRLIQLNASIESSLFLHKKTHKAWYQMQETQVRVSKDWHYTISNMSIGISDLLKETNGQVISLQNEVQSLQLQIQKIIQPIVDISRTVISFIDSKKTIKGCLSVVWVITGYFSRSSYWRLFGYVLTSMTGLILTNRMNVTSVIHSLVLFLLPCLHYIFRMTNIKNYFPSIYPSWKSKRKSIQRCKDIRKRQLEKLNLYYELLEIDQDV
ncbi:hypothetical protein BDF14DRAFT_1795060 [Spinellus fusiger]|nr:hypothetical protein BDF14DRAFT_1795060 [Spinellus fusiger]